jgi:hypothetical protein
MNFEYLGCSMNFEEKREILAEIDEGILLADGFEEALVGYTERAGTPICAAYDRYECLRILVERDGLSLEEAEEHFEFNVVSAYVGGQTPVFITRL